MTTTHASTSSHHNHDHNHHGNHHLHHDHDHYHHHDHIHRDGTFISGTVIDNAFFRVGSGSAKFDGVCLLLFLVFGCVCCCWDVDMINTT